MKFHRALTAAAPIALGLACVAAVASDEHVFVVTSDFANSTGNSAAFDVVDPWNSMVDLEVTGPGTIVRHFFGRHYVVHPQSGEIQVIDPETFDTVLTFSVGAGSVPHDIVVVDDTSAYVSRHASPLLYEVDPATGELLDTIDLGVLADADGVPEMSMMALDGQRLFIQLQRLDSAGQAVLPSYLAVVDVLTNQIIDIHPQAGIQAIELTGPIPSFKMQIEGRRLYVSEPGTFHDTLGGIDEIDLDNLEALGFITSEAQVPLDISGFILTSPTKGYVITHTDLTLSSHLQPFSRIDGSGLGPELMVTFAQVDSVAYDPATDQLFFPDHDANGVRVFDATTQEELTRDAIDTGLDPVDLVIAPGSSPGEAAGLLVESRDPATGAMSISFGPACGAADHTIVFGPLAGVDGYGYSGQVCGVGNAGTFGGFDPGGDSYFFVVVANDGAGVEGSYGTDSALVERPEDSGDPVCALTQELTLRCD